MFQILLTVPWLSFLLSVFLVAVARTRAESSLVQCFFFGPVQNIPIVALEVPRKLYVVRT